MYNPVSDWQHNKQVEKEDNRIRLKVTIMDYNSLLSK